MTYRSQRENEPTTKHNQCTGITRIRCPPSPSCAAATLAEGNHSRVYTRCSPRVASVQASVHVVFPNTYRHAETKPRLPSCSPQRFGASPASKLNHPTISFANEPVIRHSRRVPMAQRAAESHPVPPHSLQNAAQNTKCLTIKLPNKVSTAQDLPRHPTKKLPSQSAAAPPYCDVMRSNTEGGLFVRVKPE